NVHIRDIFTHPHLQVTQEGNRYVLSVRHLPPRAIAEVRFVADPLFGLPYAASNPSLTLEAIEDEERRYRTDILGVLGLSFGLPGCFLFLLGVIYLLFGREPALEYTREYEQEPPSDDPPDVVNALVKNVGGSVDDEGMASVLLDLYRLDLVDFAADGGTIVLRVREVPRSLPKTEQVFMEFLLRFAKDGQLNFQHLHKELEQSMSDAIEFNAILSSYQKAVKKELLRRRYLQTTGNILAKIVAVLMMLVALGIFSLALRPTVAHLLPLFTGLSGGVFFTGAAVLLARRDLFGRWSKEGRLFYLRWKNFARFLSEYSLLTEYPPASVVLWEAYLVYATALGLGEKVHEHLRRLIPHSIWEKESRHPYLYSPTVFVPGRNLSRLSLVAATTAAQASSGRKGWFGGGFQGGAGGFGRGSGGGRGGAF
ncbi:MAG: DUF2207 domain-containing protein, partial [Candidatus Caldatribacterium sp.]|nr:DUF2207 domain-containing protein [Candidatus Caldatribacterium sp.]